MLLEAQLHEFSSFWTLTYDDNTLPADGSVSPRHTQLWLKRLRFALADRSLRFYLVGEYGDETFRPHYHAALFGVAREETDLVLSTWNQGHVYAGELNPTTAAYIAGYVTKKATKHGDPRLQGRHPEFARMSRNPGLGAPAIPAVADACSTAAGARDIALRGDVPESLRHGRSNLPLGRYLRRKLREELGFETIGGQAKPAAVQSEELHTLLEAAGSRSSYLLNKPFIEYPQIRQIEKRSLIWKKKGTL